CRLHSTRRRKRDCPCGQIDQSHQHQSTAMKGFLALMLFGVVLVLQAAPKPAVSRDENGRLLYEVDERGNRVPDFSTCGYSGGNEQIPDAPVRVVVAPVKGDETARIQKAID